MTRSTECAVCACSASAGARITAADARGSPALVLRATPARLRLFFDERRPAGAAHIAGHFGANHRR